MHKNPKAFAEGKGPLDLRNVTLYNQKLDNYIEKSIYASNNQPEKFAASIE